MIDRHTIVHFLKLCLHEIHHLLVVRIVIVEAYANVAIIRRAGE